jgi:hypothetical protein
MAACYTGVFMEYGLPTIGFIVASERVERSSLRNLQNPLSPCDIVGERYQPACYRYLYRNQNVFAELGVRDANEVFADAAGVCGTLVGLNRVACLSGIGWLQLSVAQPFRDAHALCKTLSYSDQAPCFQSMSEMYGGNGTAVRDILDQCGTVADSKGKDACYTGLFTAVSDRVGGGSISLESVCGESTDAACEIALQKFQAK